MENELEIKTSILDYLGKINNGVSILITFTIYNFSFQGIYWIHPNDYHTLECEHNFLKLFGVEYTDDLPFLDDLIKDIDSILPNKNDIFKEFL